MKNTGEIQEAPGSGFLARPLLSKKKSELCYNLRQIKRSQRKDGGAAQKAGRPMRPTPARHRGPPGGSLLPVDAGPQHSERNQAGYKGPVSADSDFQQCALCD